MILSCKLECIPQPALKSSYRDRHSFLFEQVDVRRLTFCPLIKPALEGKVPLGWSGRTVNGVFHHDPVLFQKQRSTFTPDGSRDENRFSTQESPNAQRVLCAAYMNFDSPEVVLLLADV